MAIEFKREKGIQYLPSIKETKDFDLDGWVRDCVDDIIVYELKGNLIQGRMLE